MIPWLDFKFFGNGFGLAQPHFDGRFYWLVDTLHKDRSGKNGTFYTFSPGLGAQLSSFQWTHPRAGERRRLGGNRYVVYSSIRQGIRVRVSWALLGLDGLSLDEQHQRVRELEQTLGKPA